MKRILLSVLICTFAIGCAATVYTDQNFSDYQAKHKLVAVLPFEVTIDTKNLPDDTDTSIIKSAEKEEGELFQRQLYTQFLNKYQKGLYTVAFQDVDKTNVLLDRAGITYETLEKYTKSEIAQVLSVDSLVSGTVKRSKPMGTGAAVASTFLVGYGATNKVVVNMNIHNGDDGALIWSYDHQQTGGLARLRTY